MIITLGVCSSLERIYVNHSELGDVEVYRRSGLDHCNITSRVCCHIKRTYFRSLSFWEAMVDLEKIDFVAFSFWDSIMVLKGLILDHCQ